jgi:5'-nucleotidase
VSRLSIPAAAAGLVAAGLVMTASTGVSVQAQAHPAGCTGPLDILLTNDDGWSAPGLNAVRTALIAAGHHVTVVAPATDQSGKGGSLTTRGTLGIHREQSGANPVWSVAGTPVDSVRVGLELLLPERPDVVVSGSNFGENIARGIASGSGTVGAAYAATNNATGSIPAIDISVALNLAEATTTPRFASTLAAFPEAGVFVADLLASLQDDCPDGRLLPDYQQLHINYPALPADEIKGTEITTLATVSPLEVSYDDQAGAVANGGGDLKVGFRTADPATLDGEGRVLHDGRISVVVLDGDMAAPRADVAQVQNRLRETH